MKSLFFGNITLVASALFLSLIGCSSSEVIDKSELDLPCATVDEVIQKYPNVRRAEETNLTPDSCALKFETVEEFENWVKAMEKAEFKSKPGNRDEQ